MKEEEFKILSLPVTIWALTRTTSVLVFLHCMLMSCSNIDENKYANLVFVITMLQYNIKCRDSKNEHSVRLIRSKKNLNYEICWCLHENPTIKWKYRHQDFQAYVDSKYYFT